MGDVKCFFLTPTDRYRVELRRYVSSLSSKCEGPWSYHNASHPVGTEQHAEQPGSAIDDARFPRTDSRWPSACPCGHAFAESDQWQVNHERIYTRSDGGTECTLRDAPVGAMYDATWYPEKGPDGRSLMLVLPDSRPGIHSVWPIDLPSSNGPGWTRTGDVPNITASPSIRTPGYHGWLRDGKLVAC